MDPHYAICRGGAHDNERWPLSRGAVPGETFAWEESDPAFPRSEYALIGEIVETNLGPMWVAQPTAA